MYTIYLLAAIGAVVGILMNARFLASYNAKMRENPKGWASKPPGFFWMTVIGCCVGGFCGFFVAMIGAKFVPAYAVESGRWDLAAMRTVDSTGGVFVWGSGNVGNQTTYRVMILNKNGSLSPFQADVTNDNTTIVEEDNLKDRGLLIIRVWGYDHSAPSYNWILHPREGTGTSYEYHVPKGTVRNTFDAR